MRILLKKKNQLCANLIVLKLQTKAPVITALEYTLSSKFVYIIFVIGTYLQISLKTFIVKQ